MDPKDAKKLLVEHSEALNVLLHKKGLKNVESNNVDADETLGGIEDRDEKLSFIRKALNKAQKIPVVETFSNLGVAGSVAVTSAAVTQTEIAKNTTEVFVAEVAEDIVQKRVEAPVFVDNFVDFDAIYQNWGQEVIAEKFVEAQSYAENVSVEIQNKIETGEIEVAKPRTFSSEPEKSSEEQKNTQEEEPEIKAESKQVKEVKESSEEEVKKTTSEEKTKTETEESEQEEKTENELESQEKPLEEEVKEEAEEVKEESNLDEENEIRQSLPELPRVVTPENDTTIVSPIM